MLSKHPQPLVLSEVARVTSVGGFLSAGLVLCSLQNWGYIYQKMRAVRIGNLAGHAYAYIEIQYSWNYLLGRCGSVLSSVSAP